MVVKGEDVIKEIEKKTKFYHIDFISAMRLVDRMKHLFSTYLKGKVLVDVEELQTKIKMNAVMCERWLKKDEEELKKKTLAADGNRIIELVIDYQIWKVIRDVNAEFKKEFLGEEE